MKIAIHGREFKPEAARLVSQVFDELLNHQITFFISEVFFEILKNAGITIKDPKVFLNQSEINDAEVILSLGGDGTFLETVSMIGALEIPILGVNFGRLGFLASVQPTQIKEAIEKLRSKKYTLDERTMVHTDSSSPIFEKGMNFALNEIAISKTDTSSMIIIHAYINNEFLNSYWADGLMVATATGSTGYSLSCGGPLVMPHSENFIITPICPHNLFVRPMIVSSNSVISLKVESRSSNFLVSMDSRAKIVGDVETELTIRKEEFKAKLVALHGSEFLDTLRGKLGWGTDIRNRITYPS